MTLLALQEGFRTWLMTEPSELPPQFHERERAGLGVYLNNYRSQLLSCLTSSYPVVRAWIGEAAFDGAAAHHIDRIPPHDWTLDAYGLDFPETLDGRYPTDPEIAELARLERELALAFVGADAAPVQAGALADVDWDSAIIHLTPTFSSVPVAMNAAAIWSAINDGERAPPATRLAQPAVLLIWRDSFAPKFRTATTEEAEVLAQARDGQTFGGICAGLVARLGEERGAVRAGSYLSQWLSDGLLVHVTSSAGPLSAA